MKGVLYLIPTPLGGDARQVTLPFNIAILSMLRNYIVENSKPARKFLKSICPEIPQSELVFYELNKHTKHSEIEKFLDVCKHGVDLGLMSDAGAPGIADPGAEVVAIAHRQKVEIKPLIGSSSILLAMMAGGMNGQNFAFNGYLPIDKSERKKAIRFYESLVKKQNQTQIFIETPYRNNQLLEDFRKYLMSETTLCVACDLSLSTEKIMSLPVGLWPKSTPDFHKRPTVFILG